MDIDATHREPARMIRTKIVATLGPASSNPETLGAMIDAGVDVVRLNFSHGTLDDHARVLSTLRRLCEASGAIVAVMGDLCGPKIRLGEFADGAHILEPGGQVVVQRAPCTGSAQRFCLTNASVVDEIGAGHRILIDDGNITLQVVDKRSDELACECIVGGGLRTRAGVNLPDTELSIPSLTEKDQVDLEWAADHELDYVALSFVRRPEEIHAVRERVQARGRAIQVVAKIEKPEAIERIDAIIDVADAILVARGDLGVEMELARVPLLQKDIVARCGRAGKPVIIATQMLQSMVTSAVPTRAEVSDVANAILDSADAVMLSAETAVGQYPLHAVRVINRIAAETEAFFESSDAPRPKRVIPASFPVASAIAQAAGRLARDVDAALVAVWTESGYTARLMANLRLGRIVVALSHDPAVCREMALLFGVHPLRMEPCEPQDAMLHQLDRALVDRRLARPGDLIIVVSGTHLLRADATNALLTHRVAAS